MMANPPGIVGMLSVHVRTARGVAGLARKVAGSLALAGGLALAAGGCAPSSDKVLVDEEGNTIRLEAVFEVVSDEELTETEKRAQLAELGIIDDALQDFLLQAE